MDAHEFDASGMWRLIGAALLLAVLCAGAALLALRADAQPAVMAPPATSVPSDEIPDDPTIAPDPNQKADDNVSFPTDI